MTNCQLCFCNADLNDIIRCPKDHTFDTECFSNYLSSTRNDKSFIEYFRKHNCIKCISCDEGIDKKQLLKSSIVENYMDTVVSISTSLTAEDTKAQMIKSNSSFSDTIIKEIKDDIINLKCPHCKQSFYDFSGCLALTCSFCHKEFCGFCLKIHSNYMYNGHECVRSHTTKLTEQEIQQYDFHGTFFISELGWTLWSDKLKMEAILEYLNKIRYEVVLKSLNDIIIVLKKEELLTEKNIILLEEKIYSHDTSGVHLIRIPLVIWTLYSSKNYIKIEDAIRTLEITTNDRISAGKFVIDRVRKEYPDWKAIKHNVPGEQFQAVNYPPELSSIIFSAIEEWGKFKKFW